MKNSFFTGVALAFILLTVACGGAAEEAAPEPTSLEIVAVDIAYDITEATANAGAPIMVSFANAGTLEHNWIVIGSGTDPLVATEDDALAGTNIGVLQPGEEKSIEFSLPVGTYTYVCTIPGHAAAGMLGTLTVQ